jgi:hypothetical protein
LPAAFPALSLLRGSRRTPPPDGIELSAHQVERLNHLTPAGPASAMTKGTWQSSA